MLEELFSHDLKNWTWGTSGSGRATAHISRMSMGLLGEWFPERLLSIRGDLEWLVRSPDLARCDFFYGVFWNPVFMSAAQGPT
ncbi:hypothetical protein Trydic_g11666 [Trypoxylus dichotomus]